MGAHRGMTSPMKQREPLSTAIDLGFSRLQMHRQYTSIWKLPRHRDKDAGWEAF